MTALLTAPRIDTTETFDTPGAASRPVLRLVDGRDRWDAGRHPGDGPTSAAPVRPAIRRHPSAAVRRRRALLAVMALALIALVFPLGGVDGPSHATGSTLAGNGTTDYTVRPGDSLWSIAVGMDPNADPRPTVARLAAEIGTYQVVPGEQLALH